MTTFILRAWEFCANALFHVIFADSFAGISQLVALQAIFFSEVLKAAINRQSVFKTQFVRPSEGKKTDSPGILHKQGRKKSTYYKPTANLQTLTSHNP